MFAFATQVRDPKCEQFTVLPISFASTTIKRVCRATLQAEAYSPLSGVEAGDRIRGLLGELYGCVTPGVSWHDQSRRKVPHLLLTDDHLNADVPATVSDTTAKSGAGTFSTSNTPVFSEFPVPQQRLFRPCSVRRVWCPTGMC